MLFNVYIYIQFFSTLYIDIYLTEVYTLYIIAYIDIKYKISQILTNIHNQHQDIEHFHDSRKFPEASCPSNR